MLSNALLSAAVRLKTVRSADRDRGATAVEYGLLIALMVFVIGAGAAVFGGQVYDFFVGLGADVDGTATKTTK